jgi:3-methyl-2-oxobutanoate hydroxymethyltransferase
MNLLDFHRMKKASQKISMITCYDYCFAKIIADTDIHCVLVGDSASMVMHGYKTTISATVNMMVSHTKAVALALKKQMIIGDMPFLSYRKGLKSAMSVVQKLMQAGAHMVKMEGSDGNENLIEHIVHSGVPVMGHLGLTPQSYYQLGGFKPQGIQPSSEKKIIQQAKSLENAGCSAIVLECIPAELAKKITKELKIATIGIGAGHHTDGQVLILQDLLGMNPEFNPKLLKTYLNGFDVIKNAINTYASEVTHQVFPDASHCYDEKIK